MNAHTSALRPPRHANDRGATFAPGWWTAFFAALTLAAFTATLSAQRPTEARLAPPEDTETTIATAPQRDYQPARVFELEDYELISQEFYSHGTVGDIVLENDLARFTFGAIPEEGPRRTETGQIILRHGSLLDVVPDPSVDDRFHLFYPTLTAGSGSVLTESMEYGLEANGQAYLTISGRHERFEDLSVVTEYLMQADMPGVFVTTTVTNNSDSETSPEVLPSDLVLWGAMSPFLPGTGFVSQNRFEVSDLEFVFGSRDDVFIMIAPETGTFDVTQGGELTILRYGEQRAMEPGETRIFRRWVLVSERDPAYLFTRILERREGVAAGILAGRVIEREQAADGQMIDIGPVARVPIQISPLNRADLNASQRERFYNRPYLFAHTRPRGDFDALLPEGDYRVIPAPTDRLAPAPNVAARIRDGQIEAFDFGTSRPSRLNYRIVDADTGELIPGKLTFEPLRGTSPPRFGAMGEVRSHNVVLSSHGAGQVDVPPGNYRVIASRGPEYNLAEHRIRIGQVDEVEQVFRLRRAFETPGWISADIGARTNATPTSRVLPEYRIASAVAEGVKWLVTGDSFTATDLSDTVAATGLGSRILVSPGYRHSGSSAPFLGDFLLFPTTACAAGTETDFSLVREATTTEELVEAMRGLCPDAVLMLTRPTWPTIGYLSLQGYDPESGALPSGDYTLDFDAIQIWEGKRQGLLNTGYSAFHRILRTGNRMTAMAGSNSHGTYNAETGYPRVYVRSSTNNPAELDPDELARNIKQGLVSITNGPFVNLTVNGEPMGSQITDTDGLVEVDLEIFAADWVRVNAININVNGRFVRRIIVSQPADNRGGRIFPPADRPNAGRFNIRIDEDSILDVMVEGSLQNPMDPVNPFLPMTRENIPGGQYPVAISAPVLIDATGDGRVTLRDLPTLDLLHLDEDEADPLF